MERDLNTLCFIREQVSYPEDNTSFGYKIHDRGNRFFITFTSCLQSFDVTNRNKRMYEASNIMDCIQNDEMIQDQLHNNSWCGEMDHPQAEIKGTELAMSRVGNPHPGLTSHYIRKPRLEGNLLRANIQTDSGTEAGRNFGIKIVDGGIRPAFSARVFGELKSTGGLSPIVRVRRLITYDWVLFPSHREARADITPQTFAESVSTIEQCADIQIVFFPELAKMAAMNERATQYVCEAFDLSVTDIIGVTSTGNSVIVKENANIYVAPINDKIVRNTAKNALKDFLGGGK